MELGTDAARLVAFVAGFGVLYAVETALACRSWHASRGRRLALHAGLALINTVAVRLTVAAPLLWLALSVSRHEIGLAPLLGLAGWPEIAASVVVLDMADYWWHRFNHRIPFLWRFHQVHHVDTHVDVTTSLRFHVGELLLSGGVKAIWIVVWGPSMWGFAVFEILTSLAAQYHHSNVDLPDWLEPAVRSVNVTPRMHTSHHSALTYTLNANFSAIFSCWDRLFGTFAVPESRHRRVLGLRYGRDRDLELGYLLALPFKTPSEAREATRRAPGGSGTPLDDGASSGVAADRREAPRG